MTHPWKVSSSSRQLITTSSRGSEGGPNGSRDWARVGGGWGWGGESAAQEDVVVEVPGLDSRGTISTNHTRYRRNTWTEEPITLKRINYIEERMGTDRSELLIVALGGHEGRRGHCKHCIVIRTVVTSKGMGLIIET